MGIRTKVIEICDCDLCGKETTTFYHVRRYQLDPDVQCFRLRRAARAIWYQITREESHPGTLCSTCARSLVPLCSEIAFTKSSV